MLVIDARTGTKFRAKSIGRTCYPDGKRPVIVVSQGAYPTTDSVLVIHSVDAGIPGVTPARFYGWSYWMENGQRKGEDVVGELQVRFTHPTYPLQHVAFIPS